MSKRVVITGLGILNGVGKSREDYWQGIKEGRVGYKPITLFDASKFNVKIAGEISDFDATIYMGKKGLRTLDRSIKLMVSSAKLAIDDSGFVITDENTDKEYSRLCNLAEKQGRFFVYNSHLSEYGVLAFLSLFILLVRVFKNIKYILKFEKSPTNLVYVYGVVGFLVIAILSSLLVQNYFFLSPWNFATAIALAILDVIVRNARMNMFFAQQALPEREN